jgi:hypothetical protein
MNDISNLRVKRQVINLRNCCIWLVDSVEMNLILYEDPVLLRIDCVDCQVVTDVVEHPAASKVRVYVFEKDYNF